LGVFRLPFGDFDSEHHIRSLLFLYVMNTYFCFLGPFYSVDILLNYLDEDACDMAALQNGERVIPPMDNQGLLPFLPLPSLKMEGNTSPIKPKDALLEFFLMGKGDDSPQTEVEVCYEKFVN
jgi:hypothetical protein